MQMNIEYVEIKSGLNTLRGIKHISQVDSDVAFLIVHGYFSSNKIGPQRLYVDIADLMSRKYGSAYRFDLSGMGESDGAMTDIKLKNHVADVEKMIEYLHSVGEKKIIIIAHCMGCALILNILRKGIYKFREVIFLTPFFTNEDTLRIFFKEPKQLEDLYVKGYTYRKGFYSDRSFFLEDTFYDNFMEKINGSNSFVNIIAAKNDQFISFENNEKLRTNGKNINFIYMDNADHNFLGSREELHSVVCKIVEDVNFTE